MHFQEMVIIGHGTDYYVLMFQITICGGEEGNFKINGLNLTHPMFNSSK